MRRLASLTLLALSLTAYSSVQGASGVSAPSTTSTTSTAPPVQVSTTVLVTTTSSQPTTTTTTEPLPSGTCSEWFSTAVDVGWPIDRLERLGRIMWAESRCLPDVRGDGSYGLAQMQYSAHHSWMKSEFGITNREELYDPTLNLLTALWLAEYAEQHYGCWAQPWYMSGDWC